MASQSGPSVRDDRFISLVGAHNFRRVDGWQTGAGAHLRPGVLFRSSGLQDLTEEDGAELHEYAIAHIFDLRSALERNEEPTVWHAGPAQIWAGAECAAAANLGELIRSAGSTSDALAERLREVYRSFPHDLATAIRAVIEVLQQGEQPVLIHCAAGKDRTGFVVAMVLRALGVREDDIVADYLLTNHSFDVARQKFTRRAYIAQMEERSPGSVDVLLRADLSYLRAADSSVVEHWGSFDAYLEDVAGLDGAARDRLHSKHCIAQGRT